MDVQDQTTHTTIPSGHEIHLCRRCGWPFPNPHPSARHRRAHNKICGTISGYTNFTGSEIVSDDNDENAPNPKIEEKTSGGGDGGDDENTPNPKIEEKTGGGGGGIRGSFSRSEDDLFSDAVTEFSDYVTSQGSVNKTLDRDVFFSFNDAGNYGTNEVVNVPIEVNKVNAVRDSSESKIELTDHLVKDDIVDPTLDPSYVSKSQEAEFIEVVETGGGKSQESQTYETITEKAKDLEISKMTPEVSEIVSEEIKHEKIELDHEFTPEIIKESEIVSLEGVGEEIEHGKFESDNKHGSEVAKESEIYQNVSVLTEKNDLGGPHEQIQEVFEEPDTVLSEKEDLAGPILEKGTNEQTHKFFEKPDLVLIENENLDAPELEKGSTEHTHEFFEKPDLILTKKETLDAPELEKGSTERTHNFFEKTDLVLIEKENLDAPELEKCSKEEIQEIVEKPDMILTEKEDFEEPNLEKQSNKHTHKVVEKPDSILIEKQDLDTPIMEKSSKESQPDSILTEKQDLDAPILEKNSKESQPDSILTEKEDLDGALKSEKGNAEEVIETKADDVSNDVADVSVKTITLKDSSELIVEEGNGKVINNQDSVGSSSRNSLEANWGSVSVLSTASIDTESLHTTEKSKVNYGKSTASNIDSGTSDVVKPESKDQKSSSSDLQDSQHLLTLTKVNNEEVIAKVTNWSTGKQSTPLKNLLGEAKSPSVKKPEQKDEATNDDVAVESRPVNDDVASSPPKLIDDGKKGRKKGKGRSWVPFVCCSSVNVVN